MIFRNTLNSKFEKFEIKLEVENFLPEKSRNLRAHEVEIEISRGFGDFIKIDFIY